MELDARIPWAGPDKVDTITIPRLLACRPRLRWNHALGLGSTGEKHCSIRIEGEFEICDPEGKLFGLAGRTVISLCRCGQSANKPFGDGSHGCTGFQHPV